MSEFGPLLRHYRHAAGLSQETLAERADISTNGIGALERGYRLTPQRETLTLLVRALKLNHDDLLAFEAAAARRGYRPRGNSVPVGPWPKATTSALPQAPTSFIGRAVELEEIARLVREHRLVTLTGAGGIGKTRTALQIGRALSDAAGGAVCFVGLGAVNIPSMVMTAIAATIGVQTLPDHSLLETLLAYLRNKTLLLILDNCEQVVIEATIAAESLLAACPGVRVLATSRERLRAAGEHMYRLPSLRITDAVELFSDRARAVDHRFAVTDETAPIVGELCGRLDGIPMAIELAAARMNVLSLKALSEKLDDRLSVLSGGPLTAPPRQRTIRATIEWSYSLLAAPERRLFECLSVFSRGCTLADAVTVCSDEDVAEDEMLDLLSSLIDKSLVVADFYGSEPRYRLLEPFRRYALERLKARGDGGSALDATTPSFSSPASTSFPERSESKFASGSHPTHLSPFIACPLGNEQSRWL